MHVARWSRSSQPGLHLRLTWRSEKCRLSTRPMIGRGFILARMRVGDGATTPGSVPTVSLGEASSATTTNGATGLVGWNSTISGANVKGTANGPVVTPGPVVTTLPSPTPSVTNSVGQSDNFHLLGSARARIA
jgi:hypothetical protein